MLWRRALKGIRPIDATTSALRSRIVPCPAPDKLVLDLKNLHESGELIVKKGDPVLMYQNLTIPFSDAAPIHSPTSGLIDNICTSGAGPSQIITTITIASDGAEESIELCSIDDWRQLMPDELLQRITDAGIRDPNNHLETLTGLLSELKVQGVQHLVINAVETDPYVSANTALLREHADEVVTGASILQQACAAQTCSIAITNRNSAAMLALKKATAGSAIRIARIPAIYPAHEPVVLTRAITGTRLRSAEDALQTGVAILDAGTAFATKEAVINGIPQVTRITTLTGSPLRTPKNFKVCLGTPVEFLLQVCGLDSSTEHTSFTGGAMRAHAVDASNTFVTWDTNCIVCKFEPDINPQGSAAPCIGCNRCSDVCPVDLFPQQLYRVAVQNDIVALEQFDLDQCLECGACDYVCPSRISLVEKFQSARQVLQKQLTEQKLAEHWQARMRQNRFRLEKPDSKVNIVATTNQHDHSRPNTGFSRTTAQQEIAAAVARVKAKRDQSNDTKTGGDT